MNTDQQSEDKNVEQAPENPSRRQALKQFVLGGISAAGSITVVRSFEEKCLAEEKNATTQNATTQNTATPKVDGVSAATRTSFKMPPRDKLKEKIPLSKIGNMTVSRMILGGNLIGGWAHSRDLMYVSELVKAYHTQNKVFETFYIAEQCGINAFLGNTILHDMVLDYWKWTDGKIQFIADCSDGQVDTIKKEIDKGAAAVYIQGETTDRLVREGKFDQFEKCYDAIKNAKIPGGIGAHRIESLRAVVDHGYIPDFWMKTFHHHNYWSAQHPTEHDNIYCRRPDETKEFMESRPEPWIAFKVLAAGAIHPQAGFRFAWEGGADFLCVGMYDFQVVKDVNLAVDVLKSKLNRKRPWITKDIDRTQYENELKAKEEEEG